MKKLSYFHCVAEHMVHITKRRVPKWLVYSYVIGLCFVYALVGTYTNGAIT
jgi:hypothetical protein